MDTKLVSSIDAVAGSRLVTIGADALLVDAAKLLSDTHISLVVCDADGPWWVSLRKRISSRSLADAGKAPARLQSLM